MIFPEDELCPRCIGLGVVHVVDRQDGIDALMLCDCSFGVDQDWKLPHWSYKNEKTFQRSPCPVDWFKPEAGQEALAKVQYWREKVRISEQFWGQA